MDIETLEDQGWKTVNRQIIVLNWQSWDVTIVILPEYGAILYSDIPSRSTII